MAALLDNAPRQSDVLIRLAELEQARVPVSASKLAQDLGLPRQSVRQYLLILQEKGLVNYDARVRQRASVSLTEAGHALTQTRLGFPIIGEVGAGQATYDQTQVLGHATLLRDALDLHEGDFLLRTCDDSLTGVGIFEHDLVAIRPTQEEPPSGHVVLVSWPQMPTATLKRWKRVGQRISLYTNWLDDVSIVLAARDVQIHGWMVGHIGIGNAGRS
ncbi:LexA family protein [Deinococcus radiopugnans]|uniref:SOS-response transcriptional repressor LexA n=1 Tax=Deinococcus radiopugnans ATCC 19172 TaxID=585398 RepID=A0ABR6NPK5_9DEIO|nr:S24 family peptidase [Deinococcus radiopugnans]MBB6015952.1 SOS-response transcriptional repressor LexA [Deinococcus radiopugnans ATCC 19172]